MRNKLKQLAEIPSLGRRNPITNKYSVSKEEIIDFNDKVKAVIVGMADVLQGQQDNAAERLLIKQEIERLERLTRETEENNKRAAEERKAAEWANINANERYNEQINLNSRYDSLLKDFQAVNMELQSVKSELLKQKAQSDKEISNLKAAISAEKFIVIEKDRIIKEKENIIIQKDSKISCLNEKNEEMQIALETADNDVQTYNKLFNNSADIAIYLGRKIGFSEQQFDKMLKMINDNYKLEYAFNKVTGNEERFR